MMVEVILFFGVVFVLFDFVVFDVVEVGFVGVDFGLLVVFDEVWVIVVVLS